MGLGNSGKQYENTRHNIGWTFIDHMIEKHNLTEKDSKHCTYAIYECNNKHKAKKDPNNKLIFIKPKAFVNTCGNVFNQILKNQPYNKEFDIFNMETDKKFKVICDDLETDVGQVKNSIVGGDRGHNGIKSFVKFHKLDSFEKIKVGIGRPVSKEPEVVSKFVLSRFSRSDIGLLNDKAFTKIESYLNLKC